MSERLLLVAHGSRRASWRAPLDGLCGRMQARLGSAAVELAFMELCPPDIATAVERAVEDGVSRVRILPLFMSSGGHVQHDIAPQLETLSTRHPTVSIELLPALGEHPLVLDALCAVAEAP